MDIFSAGNGNVLLRVSKFDVEALEILIPRIKNETHDYKNILGLNKWLWGILTKIMDESQKDMTKELKEFVKVDFPNHV